MVMVRKKFCDVCNKNTRHYDHSCYDCKMKSVKESESKNSSDKVKELESANLSDRVTELENRVKKLESMSVLYRRYR